MARASCDTEESSSSKFAEFFEYFANEFEFSSSLISRSQLNPAPGDSRSCIRDRSEPLGIES